MRSSHLIPVVPATTTARKKSITKTPHSLKPHREAKIHEFAQLVAEIEKGGGRYSEDCADLVRFLAFGGCRKKEAANVTWADCDFSRGKVLVRGDADHRTKNYEIREVPMIPEMKILLERLRLERRSEPPETPVMRVHDCQEAMDRAAKVVGMPRITHHDLRRLFATRCIESGIDIPTVSRWLGHYAADLRRIEMKTLHIALHISLDFAHPFNHEVGGSR